VKFFSGKRELLIVAVLLFLAFLVRFMFFSDQGYKAIDTNDFMSWFQTAADYGPRVFYERTWCDYPPFNVYFFWIFGLLTKSLSLFGSNLFTYMMKLPPNLFDMATAFIIFIFVRKRLNLKLALLSTALYAFNPAVIYNAAIWGQFDAIYTFFLIFSLFLVFESKPKWAIVAFTLGILTKPQSIAIAPLFIYLILKKNNWSLKGTIISGLIAAGTVFAVILPFEWSNPITFLTEKYFGAYSTYPFTTLNAFNIWGFGGMWVSDATNFLFLTPYVMGWVMFAALAIFTIYFVHKHSSSSSYELIALFAAFVLFFGFFMLPTRIHERYMFPAMAVLALMFPFLKRTRPLYIALTATCFANQAYVLPLLNAVKFIESGDVVVLIVSLINSIAFVYVLLLMIGELRGKHWLKTKTTRSLVDKSGKDNDDSTR
jgi:Gpi18-like mannosyltransferase